MSESTPHPRRLLRALGAAAALVLVVLLVAATWLWREVRGSLPRTEGEIVLNGLAAPVRIDRDGLGVPTITGSTRVDVARATGFVHAQERFFQMDLLRRSAAGELAGLVGEAAVPTDRRVRLHRFRHRAGIALGGLPRFHRQLLEAYAAGVNTGLADLAAAPFEYALLGASPAPWRPEDSLLALYAMYFDLNDETARREAWRGLIQDVLGSEMLAFLAPLGTEWDAPIVGEPLATPPVPGPEVLDLRGGAPAEREPVAAGPAPPRSPASPSLRRERRNSVPAGLAIDTERAGAGPAAGSNNWALAGHRTAGGRALLANDMHLGLGLPNVWFRARLIYPGPDGGERRITGVTLPGSPAVAVGSNGRVAWGFTNTWGDWEDLVVLEPAGEGAYRTPDGPRAFSLHEEEIAVRGGETVRMSVRETIWGPVVDEDHAGRERALRWIAHDPEAANLELISLEAARTVDAALAVANRAGIPPQNFVVADADGRIAWTVMGRIPRRVGHDGRLPGSWADGERGWDGWLGPDEAPRVVDPPSGVIWTANGRVVGGEMMARIGLGTYRLGARARQIRDALLGLEAATPADLLAVQLDDRALFLERWRELLLATLDETAVADHPGRAELRRLAADDWSGRASIDSAGYRMVRAWRAFLAEEVFAAITAPCAAADPDFDFLSLTQEEGPLWRLVSERPAHLLDPAHASWEDQLLAAADATLDYFAERGGPLAAHTWGERNTVAVRHPLSPFLSWLSGRLDAPPEPLPGDGDMPRFQSPDEGASERLVVSPGHEGEGIFHMPGGQSGHPLSPHYLDGHRAWAEGEPTPFLPGPAERSLTLLPPPPVGAAEI